MEAYRVRPVQAVGVCARQPLATANPRVCRQPGPPAGNFLYSDFLPPRWIPSVGVSGARAPSRCTPVLLAQHGASPRCAQSRASAQPLLCPSSDGRVTVFPSRGNSLLGRPGVPSASAAPCGFLSRPAYQTAPPLSVEGPGRAAEAFASRGSSRGLLATPPGYVLRLRKQAAIPPRLSPPEEDHQRRVPEFGREDRPKTPEFGREDRPKTPEFGREDRPKTPEFGREERPKTPQFGGEEWPKTPEFGDEQSRQRAAGELDDGERRRSMSLRFGRKGGVLQPTCLRLAAVSLGKDARLCPLASREGQHNEETRCGESRSRRGRGLCLPASHGSSSRGVHPGAPCARRLVGGEAKDTKPKKCGKCHRQFKAKGAKAPFCVCAFAQRWGRVVS
ncbi:hypothetical protein TGME49_310340 [Toxoplasma gondii ME49]|uniref:Uncharacterized protein n=3 Tax=Toxoplasma gondii TaxID=5811 RepID=B6KAA2_TOXGV|nr:hypothetical protein TGME49_310340 [Toxoplasma gondii ME49]EPT26196.1 hypothetical protein TGME49_310340 [Toxoplasma gondii ME49]ESS34856.1 hypothetical protein TGVEG_310340 [Toxoplasma gondii VEG]KYF47642.1 hypothetical protein TGARI_310340 [Toxoplasma gondii ARI]CEL77335.1 TPA: hypothetical protein BN1205_094420 [Toxoplasma gondii VEG]|eukprot:XP_002364280.1 hypothetical protein TGME49_310340 [Toxoplasma gondii ME49]